jgi:hypothetical protein
MAANVPPVFIDTEGPGATQFGLVQGESIGTVDSAFDVVRQPNGSVIRTGAGLTFSLVDTPAWVTIVGTQTLPEQKNVTLAMAPDQAAAPGDYRFEVKVTDAGQPALSGTLAYQVTVRSISARF